MPMVAIWWPMRLLIKILHPVDCCCHAATQKASARPQEPLVAAGHCSGHWLILSSGHCSGYWLILSSEKGTR